MRVLVLALAFSLAWAMDFSKIIEGEITALKGDTIVFKTSAPLKIGEVGLVVHSVQGDSGEWRDASFSVRVTSLKDKLYSGTLIATKELMQKYLPTPTVKPKAGYKVLFHSQNLRAFLIAPNEVIYSKAKMALKDHEIISSDVLEGYLASRSAKVPTRELLGSACELYSTNLVFIYHKGALSGHDCTSFAKLGEHKIANPSKEESLPFFARIKATHGGGLFSFSSDEQSYDEIYDGILNPK